MSVKSSVGLVALSELKPGEEGIIRIIESPNESFNRLSEMGIIEGQKIRMLKRAPLGDPIEIRVMSYNLCLRISEASCVMVEKGDKIG